MPIAVTTGRERGRPSKDTPSNRAAIIAAIRAGNYYQPACASAGVSYDVFREWMRGGEDGDPRYTDFYQQVQEAESHAERRAVRLWRSHMPEDYKAARDFLARRHPERWAEQSKRIVQHEGAGTTINVITLDTGNLSAIYGLLQAASAQPTLIEGDIVSRETLNDNP